MDSLEHLINTRDAEDKKRGMTLDELGSFVQTAHRLGVNGDARVLVRVGWRQQIQQITIGDDR